MCDMREGLYRCSMTYASLAVWSDAVATGNQIDRIVADDIVIMLEQVYTDSTSHRFSSIRLMTASGVIGWVIGFDTERIFQEIT